MHGLFRPESLRGRFDGGSVIVHRPPNMGPATIVLVTTLALLLGSLEFIDFSRTVRAQGWVVPAEGIIHVVARRSGYVKNVLVAVGQHVTADQPICLVDIAQHSLSGGTADLDLEALKRQASSLKNDYAAQDAADDATVGMLSSRRQKIVDDAGRAQAQIGLQAKQIEIGKRRLTRMMAGAGDGIVSINELDAAETAVLAGAQRLIELGAQASSSEQEAREVEASLKGLAERRRSRASQLEELLAGIARQTVDILSAKSDVLLAPNGGTVALVSVTAGQRVDADHTVATILPDDSRLKAEIYTSSDAIGFIKAGQPVRLRYAAFPYIQYGAQEVTLTDVSLVPIDARDITLPDLKPTGPMFRIRATLSSGIFASTNGQLALRPGMSFDAEITLERRTFLRELVYGATHGSWD